MNHVQQVRGEVGNGSTCPKHAGLDNEDVPNALIKTKGNPQGILALVNEIICYHLAIDAGIAMPKSGVALIDEDTDDLTGCLSRKDYGTCFFSQWIEKVSLPNKLTMSEVDNRGQFETIILFDHIIYNTDRNRGNLLITSKKGPKKLYVIDHSHVFKNQTIWDRYCLERGIEENDYKDETVFDANGYEMFTENATITQASLKEAAENLSRSLTQERVSCAINTVPADWPTQQENMLSLKKYLNYRISHLEEICEMISGKLKRR